MSNNAGSAPTTSPGASAADSTIVKSPVPAGKPVPNLLGYAEEREAFTWEHARAWIGESRTGSEPNIAYQAVDRHVAEGWGDQSALRCIRKDGSVDDLTYSDLAGLTDRFANVLAGAGVQRGERVFGLMGRTPELFTAMLGTLKRGAVFSPLFSAFGPEPIRERMVRGDATVLVTTPALYRRKVEVIRDEVPSLRLVLLVGELPEELPDGTTSLARLMSEAEPSYEIPPTDPEDMALLHFTSGTTGKPKGAVHVHDAVVHHHESGRVALDMHPGEIYWCTADPGWVTGTSYGVIAPLTNRLTLVVDEGEFDVRRWYGILSEQRVSIWYTAPTAVRMLMKAGADLAHEYDLSALRFVASVGEPLNPEAVLWGVTALGMPIHDNWWQTETGGIMIANYAACDVHPGSMGRPLPGITATVLRRAPSGEVLLDSQGSVVEAEPGELGELAVRAGWPSMFRDYLHDSERYQQSFADGWYLSGDLARHDQDGNFWFVGRGDDVIKSAGHLVGPFEVESTLLEHEAVAEAGVIGVPDEVMGERIKAFVSLKPGVEASTEVRRSIVGHCRKRLGPAVAPREIEFTDALPKTRSGKIMRRLLKARELGLPEGDLSTLEGAS
jgi:acetyl-CoA synthetase